MAKEPATVRKVLAAMKDLTRIASAMVDGEELIRLTADDYDIKHQAFLRLKKLSQRLARLVDFPCGSALWAPARDADGRLSLLLHNGNVHRYYAFGDVNYDCPPEIAECLRTGATVVAPPEQPCRTLTVLAPVFDSLGDVTGVVELSALDPRAKALAPAYE